MTYQSDKPVVEDFAQDPSNVLTGLFEKPILQPIKITDNSLRDGEQFPHVAYNLEDKLALAKLLNDIGVYRISVGFPAVSELERQTIKSILALGLDFPDIGGLARMVKSDIDHLAEVGLKTLGLFLSTSDSHMHDKLGMTEEQAHRRMEESVAYANELGLKVVIGFEDATRTPLPRLLRLCKAAADLGATEVHIADTVGILTPTSTHGLFSLLRQWIPIEIGCHFHNDLGMATANSLAALEAGADVIDTTLCGLGERTGNTPLEQLAVALRVKYGRDLGMRLDLLPEASKILARRAQVGFAPNKPIIGEHVFSHESGIHVHGLMANPECYQPFPPALVGRKHRIIYGKHSGLNSIARLLSSAGIELPRARQEELLVQVKKAAEGKTRVSEDDVQAWALELAGDVAAS